MDERVFLSGPMGSGKSHLARALSRQWKSEAVDLDALIEQRAGATVSQLFAQRGEAGFRTLETEVLEGVLGGGARIVSLGGGTVKNRALRHRLLREGTLISLTASLDTLTARVGTGGTRPLVAGQNVRQRLSELLDERGPIYAECHALLATDAADPAALARQISAVARERAIVVPLLDRTYRVHVGAGVRGRLGAELRRAVRGRQVVVVTDTGVEQPWAGEARQAVEAAGFGTVPVCLAAGETHKNIASIEAIWDAALDAGVDRDALVLAVGGGVVGDMAGFAAATILRGIGLAQLPTTLLAMVDSAVGGKTGIDRPQGKNLIGSFEQPRFVLCDIDTLSTLPIEEVRAGLAEVIKSAWLDGEASVALLERHAAGLLAIDPDATTAAVRMSVKLKARIVTEDEKEAGARALLNLGHTVGHAIEAAGGYAAVRHGEAVALGLVAAFRVARRLGHASGEQAERVTALLARMELPTDVDRYLDERALGFLSSDKKRQGGKVRFVVPGAPGSTQLVALSPEEIARLTRA